MHIVFLSVTGVFIHVAVFLHAWYCSCCMRICRSMVMKLRISFVALAHRCVYLCSHPLASFEHARGIVSIQQIAVVGGMVLHTIPLIYGYMFLLVTHPPVQSAQSNHQRHRPKTTTKRLPQAVPGTNTTNTRQRVHNKRPP